MNLSRPLLVAALALAPAAARAAAGVALDHADDEVARLQALAAIPDTDEAARARQRLLELASGSDVALAVAAAEALGTFGVHGEGALAAAVRGGAAEPARQRALELLLARRPAPAPRFFAQLAASPLPAALRLLALDGVTPDAGGDVRALLESLLDPREPRVAARALRLLAEERSEVAVEFARGALGADLRAPLTLQVAAIDVLRADKSRASIERLIDVAGQHAGEVREFAFKSLLVTERGSVVLALLPMLSRHAAAARALVATEVVARFDLADLPELRAALRGTLGHPGSEVRAAVLRTLAATRDVQALPLIERATLDPDPLVAAAAIHAATELRRGDPAWRDRLLQFARARLPAQRLAAAVALADADDPACAPALLALLCDEQWRVREQAARGLGSLRAAAAVPALIERVAQDRRRVRLAAAAALRRISGMPFVDLASDWRRWWHDHAEGFVPPPLAEVEAMEARLATNRARATTRASFYGLPVESDHLALVIDVSGSMGAPDGTSERTKLDVAKQEVDALVAQLEPGARLNLVFFSDDVRRWKPRLARIDRASANQATSFTRGQRAAGSTNLCDALAAALDDPDVDTVYLLSDGAPTSGRIVDPALLRADVRHRNPGARVRLHCISIGGSSPLLRHLAADSGGHYVER